MELVPGITDDVTLKRIVPLLLYEDIGLFELTSRLHFGTHLFAHAAEITSRPWPLYTEKEMGCATVNLKLQRMDHIYSNRLTLNMLYTATADEKQTFFSLLEAHAEWLRYYVTEFCGNVHKVLRMLNFSHLTVLHCQLYVDDTASDAISTIQYFYKHVVKSPMRVLKKLNISAAIVHKTNIEKSWRYIPIDTWNDYISSNHPNAEVVSMTLTAADGSLPPLDSFPRASRVSDRIAVDERSRELQLLKFGDFLDRCEKCCWITGFEYDSFSIDREAESFVWLTPKVVDVIRHALSVRCFAWYNLIPSWYPISGFKQLWEIFSPVFANAERVDVVRFMFFVTTRTNNVPLRSTDYELIDDIRLKDEFVIQFLFQLSFLSCTKDMAVVLLQSERFWRF